MRARIFASRASALFVFATSTSFTDADPGHSHVGSPLHRKFHVHREVHRSIAEENEVRYDVRSIEAKSAQVEKRGTCQFPSDAGLVAVTPDQQNGGWAMSPDQPCTPGNHCPYACPSGQVSMQWDPSATSYSYPESMNGGLFCDSNGIVQKPFPENPYCKDGTGNIGVKNKCDGVVSFCQTVLPGNEAMLIPTSVQDFEKLAVPGPDYWCETAAHFYINPPGVHSDKACIWGSKDSPVGNWAAYVAGANTDKSGNTFIKLGYNPVYLEPATPFRNEMPTWGVEITCDGPGCNGLPCKIDPKQNSVNQMVGGQADGAGGAAFCVVTVPKGVNANFEIFDESGGNNGGNQGDNNGPAPSSPSSTPPSSSWSPSPSSSASDSSTYSSTSSSISSSTSSFSSSLYASGTGYPLHPSADKPGVFVQMNATSSFAPSSIPSSLGSASGSASPSKQTTSVATQARVTADSMVMCLLIVGLTFAFWL